MLYLTQLKDEGTIRSVFIDAMNSSLSDVRLGFLSPESPSKYITIDITSHNMNYGQIYLEGNTDTLSSDSLAVVTNAIRMLAIILENRHQARLLADENLRLESAVAARVAEIAANEKLLRMRYESIPAGIVVHDKTGEIIYANAVASDILSLNYDELLGRTSSDYIWKSVWEDGTPAPGEEHPAMVVLKTGEPVRNVVLGTYADDPVNTKWLLINSEPILDPVSAELKEVMVTFLDITESKLAEQAIRNVESQKQQFFHDTILSVTGGKFDICDKVTVDRFKSEAIMNTTFLSIADIHHGRQDIVEFCSARGLNGERLRAFIIGVGEAANNALKHGKEGTVYAGVTDNSVWIGVSDKGNGIESIILPQAVLMRGFSTKPSLGLGYSIMLDVCDQIYLYTSSNGTTIILLKEINEHKQIIPLDQFPDTWDSIPT
jgi:anti-sigma regulatory factor (Ser/Thr protein kinase)/PAS domain-containing protein